MFIGTAISQYGALEALIVAFLQARCAIATTAKDAGQRVADDAAWIGTSAAGVGQSLGTATATAASTVSPATATTASALRWPSLGRWYQVHSLVRSRLYSDAAVAYFRPSLPESVSQMRYRRVTYGMALGELKYTARLDGLSFPEGERVRVSLDSELGEVELVLQTPDDGSLEMTLRVPVDVSTTAQDRLEHVCNQIVEGILNLLAFHREVGIGPASLMKSNIEWGATPAAKPARQSISRSDGVVRVEVTDAIAVNVTAALVAGSLIRTLVFGAGRGEEVEAELTSTPPSTSFELAFFREAMRAGDVRVRYVLLYSLLDMFHGPRQDEIDDWILGQLGDEVRMFTKPPRRHATAKKPPPRDQETVFTRIRNDIAHAGERGRSQEDVLQDAASSYKDLVRLAKAVVRSRWKSELS